MAATEKGFLLIADISGYTSFLRQSELEPAAEHLRALLNLLIEQTRPPLIVSRLQGDAVISYAPEGSFLQGQTLVEIVESTYIAFREALDLAVINNACDCSACRLIPSLDVKFFVHHGDFRLQQLGSHNELVGPEVNLVHRLTKNTITEKTGTQGYVAYTQAAVDALGIQEQAHRMVLHEEEYEHIGRVHIYVQDMHAVWEHRQSQLRSSVAPEDALLVVEKRFPVAPVLMWDYVTKPEYKALLSGSVAMGVSKQSGGRTGPGTVYRCAYGGSVSTETIVEWEPFVHYSYESPRSWGVVGRTTIELLPFEGGTKVSVLASKGRGGMPPLRRLQDLVYRRTASQRLRNGLCELQARISEEMAAGKVVGPSGPGLTPAELDREVIEVLTA